MYFFPYTLIKDSSYFGNIDFGIGVKNLLYGNWGGVATQNTLHFLVSQTRPAPLLYEPYNYRGFFSAALIYSYGGFSYLRAKIRVKVEGKVKVYSITLDSKLFNEFMKEVFARYPDVASENKKFRIPV